MATETYTHDVLCVGIANYDLIFSVSHHPAADEKMFATALTGCGGGPAANAAVTVRRLGYRSGFAGYLGHDAFGDEHLRELLQEGVDANLIIRGPSPTPLSVILVKPGGDRSVVNYRGLAAYLAHGEINFTPVIPKVILFDGHEPLISSPLVQRARDLGIKTILDAGSVHRGTLSLVDRVDYLVCSRRFSRESTGEEKEDVALRKLVEHAPNVIITLGEHGLIWGTETDSGRLPAFDVDVVDTTGAGDAFHGAFAVGVANEWDLHDILRYASVVAALCCTKIGARIGIPTASEVATFLEGA